MSINYGWESRYDYEGMSNVEKYCGRKLHTQDNNWELAKFAYALLIVAVIYLLATEFSWVALVHFFRAYLF